MAEGELEGEQLVSIQKNGHDIIILKVDFLILISLHASFNWHSLSLPLSLQLLVFEDDQIVLQFFVHWPLIEERGGDKESDKQQDQGH